MNKLLKIGLLTCVGAFLLSCDNQEASDDTAFLSDDNLAVEEKYTDDDVDETYYEPYPEFCLQGSRLDIDPHTLKAHDCEFTTEGRYRADLSAPKAHAFFADISHFPALEQAGIEYFGIDVKYDGQPPKITKGVYTLAPYEILSSEEKQLPNMMAYTGSIKEDTYLFFALMQPDIKKLTDTSNVPFEIVSATLNVTHVEDVVLDEDEKSTQKYMKDTGGFLTGKQYVKGTFTFQLKKLGTNGADFGPETFTFASISEWWYHPKAGE